MANHYLGRVVLVPWTVVAILVAVYSLLHLNRSFRRQSVLAVLAFTLFFSLGTQRLSQFKTDDESNHLLQLGDAISAYKAFILQAPEVKENSIQCKLKVYEARIDSTWRPVNGSIIAYVDKESGSPLNYGDLLLVKGQPRRVKASTNPGSFDYRQYLNYQGVHHQHFIGDQFNVIGHSSGNWFVNTANKLRMHCMKTLQDYIKDDDARAIIMALVLGVKDDLGDDVIKAFSATGAMHVLAVSGLHVGIIYAFLVFFFKRFGLSNHKYQWILAVTSVLILWMYAMLTGLSPSVLRAVTMFTFIAIGRALSRHSNIYNTLAASALALLLYNPYLIMSVGFQLSYLAVFGIVYIQPKLYRLIEVDHWFLDKVWAITCVSIAAQLATAPLSILYFHQFPSYFLLSNLFIIPSAFIILFSALLLLAISPFAVIASALAWLLTKFLQLVNTMIFGLSDLPGSVIGNIYFSASDTWLVYGLLFWGVLFFIYKKLSHLRYAVLFSLLFATSQLWNLWQYKSTSEFSVLDVSNSQVFDFRKGFESQLLADSLFTNDTQAQSFHLTPKRLRSASAVEPGEDQPLVQKLSHATGFSVAFDGKLVLYLNKKPSRQSDSTASIEVDWLILGNDAVTDLNQLEMGLKYDQLIIDPTNSWFTDKRLTLQADSLQINYHSIRQDGYYSRQWKRKNMLPTK